MAKIPFQAYEYDIKKWKDAKSIAELLNKEPERIFKTLVAISPAHEYFVFIVPSNKELDLKKAASFFGVKSIEMLPLKKLLPTTGYIHGGCSPLGMKKNFPTCIDLSAKQYDTFCISGGKIGVTIEINPEKLAQFIGANFSNLTL